MVIKEELQVQKINNGTDNNGDDKNGDDKNGDGKNGDDKNGDEIGGSGEVIGSEQTSESTNHELCDSRAPATKSKTSKRSMYNQ